MRELTLTQVRAAGLPAHIELADVTYEYRPLGDDVAVRFPSSPGLRACTTSHIPETGWRHVEGCWCEYCQGAKEARRGAQRRVAV
jgi:hypothetical protein